MDGCVYMFVSTSGETDWVVDRKRKVDAVLYLVGRKMHVNMT